MRGYKTHPLNRRLTRPLMAAVCAVAIAAPAILTSATLTSAAWAEDGAKKSHDCFKTMGVKDFDAVGDGAGIVRDSRDRAFRIDFADSCQGMSGAKGIRFIAGNRGRVCGYKGDFMKFKGGTCTIVSVDRLSSEEVAALGPAGGR